METRWPPRLPLLPLALGVKWPWRSQEQTAELPAAMACSFQLTSTTRATAPLSLWGRLSDPRFPCLLTGVLVVARAQPCMRSHGSISLPPGDRFMVRLQSRLSVSSFLFPFLSFLFTYCYLPFSSLQKPSSFCYHFLFPEELGLTFHMVQVYWEYTFLPFSFFFLRVLKNPPPGYKILHGHDFYLVLLPQFPAGYIVCDLNFAFLLSTVSLCMVRFFLFLF